MEKEILIYILIGLGVLNFLLLIVLLRSLSTKKESEEQYRNLRQEIEKDQLDSRNEISQSIQSFGQLFSSYQKNTMHLQMDQYAQFNQSLSQFEINTDRKLNEMRNMTEARLFAMQNENSKKLEQMQNVVDEKLQKTLDEKMNESFRTVSESLKQVYQGLGEMQKLAGDVGDLKNVLSNVKTRGILGEIQLGAILEEILASNQYRTNVEVVPNSQKRVEYAICLPGNNGSTVYLPIDSKFPSDAYMDLQNSYLTNDPKQIEECRKVLQNRIRAFAKDISDKYIEVPYTTDFAIMFLPFEGLYLEAINSGLSEVLQREYHVNIAGPSTMAALLNSLQMGFRTLAIEKRSSEVWEILGAVKSEFDKFETALTLTQTRLNQANSELDKLVGVRTRAIVRKLKDVQSIDGSTHLLESDEEGE